MKLSFTTLGCPEWDLDTLCKKGRAYGFDGVDFRGLLDTLDVTRLPAFNAGLEDTQRKLANAGLEVSGFGSSITLCSPERHRENLEEAQRTIAAAKGLGCANVRVFGGGDLKSHTRAELVEIAAGMMADILALDGAGELHWLFETHDHWIHSADCLPLLERIPGPAFGALWDMGHTPRVGGETPAETYKVIGKRIGYTHIKDATYDPQHPLSMEDGWRYMIPGTGELPLAEAIGLLKASGYDGWIVLEHEKRWHANLPEPEEIFPAFVRWARLYV
jgi:sugar phosphate isomerase/epimerase